MKYIKREKRKKVEQLEGVLAEIIYQNEVNSYVVGIFRNDGRTRFRISNRRITRFFHS